MKKYLGFIIQIVIGMACGVLLGVLAAIFLPPMDGIEYLILTIVGLGVSFYLHIILHEGGHLVCGLLSGYKFVSFRIGSLILIKSNGKYHIKKFSIPGTAGQCLLDPPEMADGKYPAKLYNLGGGLSNLLFAGLAMIGVIITESAGLGILLLTFFTFGVMLGLTNLIPLKMSGIANDGYNIMSLDKDSVGSKALWQQLRVNRLQSDGVRLKDMEDELFDLASSEVKGNPLVDQMKLFYMQRLMDEKRFDEARGLGESLVVSETLELLKNMARVELLFLELIGPCREAEVKRRYDRNMKKWLKAVNGYPSTHRVKYAYAVHFAHDEKMTSKAAAGFAKTCKSYPLRGEIETEKVLFKEV